MYMTAVLDENAGSRHSLREITTLKTVAIAPPIGHNSLQIGYHDTSYRAYGLNTKLKDIYSPDYKLCACTRFT